MSYSENTHGSVAEHEAMQSTVMNRAASGEKYWVDKGRDLNEHNIIAAGNPKQYLGTGSEN